MCASIALGLLLSVLINSAAAVCTLDDIECCLTEFANFVSPRGIILSEQKVASVCTFREETVECLDTFLDQCSWNVSDLKDVEKLINKTQTFITQICPPDSKFMQTLKEKEGCILNSSASFQACYNRSMVPDDTNVDASKAECCEYKALRNCAVQSVEDKCGPVASQLVHDDVENINGAVLEWSCADTFNECGNSAVMLASSIFYVLYSISILKFLL